MNDLRIELEPGYGVVTPLSQRAASWLRQRVPDSQFGARFIIHNHDLKGVLRWMKHEKFTLPMMW